MLGVQAILQNSVFYLASIWLKSLKDDPFQSTSQVKGNPIAFSPLVQNAEVMNGKKLLNHK